MGRDDTCEGFTRLLFHVVDGLSKGIGEVGSHDRVHTRFREHGENVGHPLASLQVTNEFVLGTTRVGVAEKPVGADE